MSEVEIEDKPHHGNKTYWCKYGKYQKESDILQKLVPDERESQDTRIELYRRAANTYYEIYNNGGMNFGDGADGEYVDDGIRYGIRAMQALGIELPITMKLIAEFSMYDDNGDETGDTDKYFEDASVEIDEAMDQVIEYILSFEGKEGFTPLLGDAD